MQYFQYRENHEEILEKQQIYGNTVEFLVLLDYVIMKLYLQAGADGETHIRVGKLNLVDLAGSERQAKTGATVSQSH